MLKKIREASTNLIIPLSFILPISMLYLSNPSSFEIVWKGRAPYLIFLWLLFLELALAWKKLPNEPLRITAIAITTAPTYLIGVFAFALNDEIMELGKLLGAPYLEHGQWILESWALSTEYVVLTICFVASILLIYKIDGLKIFSISTFFIGAISCFYMIDTFYPLGTLDPLQGFVPFIASLVVSILNGLGYKAKLLPPTPKTAGMQRLRIAGLRDDLAIAWGCAGVQSFFIYTFVILLFVKNARFSLHRETIYNAIPKRLKFIARSKRVSFLLERRNIRTAIKAAQTFVVNVLRMVPVFIVIAIGAVGTFLVNLLRIVSICIVGVHMGPDALSMFHEYYGELFFIAWIIAYVMVIIYGDRILTKLSALAFKLKGS